MNAVCHEAALVTPVFDAERIDFTRHFIAEEFTPLCHTQIYRALPDSARLRYNQLHAFYFNEQVAFFEQEMLSPMLLALQQQQSLPPKLGAEVRIFFDEEQRHTSMFRALNQRCAPELYAKNVYHFIRVPSSLRTVLRGIAKRPRLFPLFLWLALLQEERSLYYSKGCLRNEVDIEPHFLAAHRSHLADEVGHIGWDGELLDWLWPRVSGAVRFFNARLLRWMIGEFFLLPKRSGLRVIEQLAREFPQLDGAALACAMRELANDNAYLNTLYSREITPRSFARFDAHPEFGLLARTLPGYCPTTSAA